MSSKRPSAPLGPKNRQLRVGELLRRRLAEVLSRGEVHDPELNRFSLTVSEVRMSNDLKMATVYVMPLGGEGADIALKALRRNKGEIRHQISRDLGLKFTPDLKFELDMVFDRMDETRRILSDPKVVADLQRPDVEDEDDLGEDEGDEDRR